MSAAEPTTARYKSPIPPNVKIAATKPELGRIQEANLGYLLHPENGGYYLKDPKGGDVIAIASDRLCSVLDDSYMSLVFHYEREGLTKEAEEVMDDLFKAGIDAAKLKANVSDEVKSGACVLDDEPDGSRAGISGDDYKPNMDHE